ncbi:beta-N-acetylglucosaminidase domain-containing protein [Bifidobacterium jacchi]|uniref:Beta-N-acetylglucosaminidase n=1 Tax=Bifidobacterium jacchi TaxID=2490545 RepID=A0A5N5RGE7_9BIFI|nr:beta-N-acetylglucosaminidase domain-containing protein [Bifidobacterium jacchi]KAB5606352.1 beta-N-acetylglucosaminidase [Bifidobacterium jacchi]
MHKVLGGILAAALALGPVFAGPVGIAQADETTAAQTAGEYTLYPKPHSVTYDEGRYILRDINVVYDDDIDSATKARLNEVAKLKNLKVTESEAKVDGKTNVYVGVEGSGDTAEKAIDAAYKPAAATFEKNDSYFLKSDNGTIAVLGKDTDSSFYGLTTLYQVFGQLDSLTVRNFTITDYADVASRGFIEGYYGNPWSTQDRINLMKFGGYYKMNAYFYAPKDDPKHNANWRDLYTEDEINTKIKPLAEAGNESKTRFVFALHPFMNRPFSFSNYDADLATLKAKFLQAIKVGVRQIAILADDAANVGGDNYTRLLNDMVAWLKELKAGDYPDMKTTLPFVTQEYMYNGESYYQNFPKEVQVVMTGGRIWGEVSQNFVNTFYNNAKRGPFMWINWPCTDNSKNHLIMSGYTTFLHPGVDPAKIQGIMLNPMQQSEPSKVAIFGNAVYSWNIWQSEEEADAAWDASFAFVDHNTAVPTAASNALRELSKHMANQAMDNRVTPLQESVELAPKLTAVKDKLTAGTLEADDAYLAAVKAEFVKLQQAAATYAAQGNKQLIGETEDYSGADANEQLGPWLDSWKDTTKAALAYIAGIEAAAKGDVSDMLKQYSAGQAAFAASKSHGFYYVGETKYAEVGVQHIVPFIKAMDAYLGAKAQQEADPSVVTKTYISNKFMTPGSGTMDAIFDGDDSTIASFQNPNKLAKDDYIGVKFSQPITVNAIRFAFGPELKNHFNKSKLQYTTDGTTWKDVNDKVYDRPNAENSKPIEETGLNLEGVTAVRLIATEANALDLWVDLAGIDINKVAEPEDGDDGEQTYDIKAVTLEKIQEASGKSDAIHDGVNTENPAGAMYKSTTQNTADNWGLDWIDDGAAIVLDLGEAKSIGSVIVAQGDNNAATDHPDSAVIETSTDGSTYTKFGDLGNVKDATVTGTAVTARYVRIRNTAKKKVWWRVREITVKSPAETQVGQYTAVNATYANQVIDTGTVDKLYDKNTTDSSVVMFKKAADGEGRDTTQAGASITLDLGATKKVGSVVLSQGQANSDDIIIKGEVQVSTDGTNFTKFGEFTNGGKEVTVTGAAADARYVRVENKEATEKWWRVREITVNPPVAADLTKYVYTNLDNATFTSSRTDDTVTLSNGTVSLAKGKYVGLDFGEIVRLKSATLTVGAANGLKTQTSDNGVVWTDVPADGVKNGTTARYIRVVNTADTAASAAITAFNATIDAKGVYGKMINSNIPVNTNWGTDTRNTLNAFDGDMNTVIKFAGQPAKDNVADFDLGQPIVITSLRIYTADSQYDYIRDSVIQMSADGKTWVDAFTIGDGMTDTDTQNKFGDIVDANKQTDSQYPNVFYYGKDDIANGKGMRYLRIKATVNYPVRALAFNEFMVNRGAYVSTETSAAFTATVIEERGHIPSNMLDKDLTTTYKPSAKNGSLTYKIDDASTLKSFRFVQAGEASGATVTGHVADANGTVSEVTFGTLDQSINAFNVPDGKTLIDVTVAWTDKLPELSEFVKVNSADKASDVTAAKTALKTAIDAKPDAYDTWTADSKSAYDAAKATATKVHASPQIAVSSITMAKAALQSAIDSAETKADAAQTAALKKLVDEAVTNDEFFYTAATFADYTAALDEVKTALKATDNLSGDQATALKTAVETAKGKLAYSTYQSELAQLALDGYDGYKSANYTEDSYKALADAKAAIDALVKNDAATPQQFKDAREAYVAAKDALVNAAELAAAVTEAEGKKQSDYTTESWKPFAEALANAKAQLKSGTAATVADALAALKDAQGKLVPTDKPVPNIASVIKEMQKIKAGNYTADSYATLKTAIDKAEADLKAENTDAYDADITAMRNAESALVSIVGLKAKVGEAKAINAKLYTTASYGKVAALIADDTLATLYQSGTKAAIDARIDAIGNAIAELVYVSTDVDTYVKDIEVKAKGNYTDTAYKAYVDAYNALKALADKPAGTVSLDEFTAAKDAFEAAERNLTLKKADYSAVEDAKAKVPADLSGYTDASVAALKKALAAVTYGLDITKQSTVDGYAKAINEAVKGLKAKDDGTDNGDNGIGKKPGKKPGNVADTGSSIIAMAVAAAIALVAGAGLMATRRRRA